jgi:hypothetical protein
VNDAVDVLTALCELVDARAKPWHDGVEAVEARTTRKLPILRKGSDT